MGLSLLRELRATSGLVRLPSFDKATDDRRAREAWKEVALPVDVVLFEGWCVGSTAQDEQQLEAACNDFERQHDPDGAWRRAVNRELSGPYAELFAEVDALVYLRVPSFEHVLSWRLEQERHLRTRADLGAGIMSDAQVRQFVCYFERLTRHMLHTMPAIADLTVTIADDHQPQVVAPS
jgi:D-glycerate 3-kinase